ncbi:MAG TPA: rRNA maturation RNase YbeY [Lentimicrobium sp.]|nr:rRNA maturation RNase YbeY [Lentimicrobium sp.]
MGINFFSEEISFTLDDPMAIRNWIFEVIKDKKSHPGTINYIFCNDNYLLALNQQYLGHDTFTDIITFDYSKEKVVSGDIFISIERVKENSAKFSIPFSNELNRVIIHGVLHLCGQDDKTETEKKSMRQMEDHYLQRIYQ